MAVKAKAEITLSHMIDVIGTYRYYLLQSSTASAPSKPTTYPPSASWDDTEPSYTDGSTNSLYYVDCSVYSNDTFYYSPVSLSTAYEAAKSAYNKATAALQTAQDAADDLQNQLDIATDVIVGTQTAATNAWTGVAKFASLTDGQQIVYWLPWAGTSSSATLNLTLSGGGTTGAKNVYYKGTTRVTTHYSAGSTIRLTYREGATISGSSTTYTGWWADGSYEGSNTYDRVRYQQVIKCGTTAIVAKNIIVGASGVYKHLKAGTAFDVTYPILYANAAISASSTGNNNYICIPFAVATTQSMTLTAYKPVYIKGTLSGTMFTPVSTTPLTQTIPTSNDGYFYMLLGTAYSTSSMYLLSEHPLFKYDGTAFKSIEQILLETQETANNTKETVDDLDGLITSWCSANNKTLIDGSKIYTGTVTTDKLASKAVTAEKIDVENLFAQDITATGSITGMKFISTGTDNYGYESEMTLDAGSLLLESTEDSIYHFSVEIAGHDTMYTYKVDSGAYNTLKVNGNCITLTDRPNGLTGTSTEVFKASTANNLVTCSNLKVTGTTTLNGHVYLAGANASSSTANTSQLVFGTSSNNHVVLSSNTHALVVNPSTSATTNQIVLYLDKASVFPCGISANVTGNLTGNASSATTLTGLTATVAELNYCDGVTSNIQTQLNNKMNASITSLELNASGSLANYGGFIDFHFNGSTADYTSRIIENASGQISINNVTITTGKVVTATTFVGALSGNATSATKATNDKNGRDITRIYCSMIPAGTSIPASADLNSTTYLKVGNYYCSSNATAATLLNCPLSTAFMMSVYSPLSTTIDNETTGTWVYRIRKIMHYNTGVEYMQYCYVGGTAGEANWIYGDWYVVPRSLFTLDSTDTNGGSATIGSASKPVYISSNGTLTACSAYAGGTAVTLNGASKAASTASFYAPTSVGTSGYLLKSNGSGAPTWVAPTSYNRVYNSTSFTSSTSLASTGVTVTIPAGSYYSVTAIAMYGNSQPLQVRIHESAIVGGHVAYAEGSSTISTTASGYTTTAATTLTVYAKYASAASNTIRIMGFYVTP